MSAVLAVALPMLAALTLGALSVPTSAEAAFPGTNGKIAFSSLRDGKTDIWTMNADGTGQARVTNDAVDDAWPSVSPEGKRIVFQKWEDDLFSDTEIAVINADGTGFRQLTENGKSDIDPAFSPDGTRVAFVSDRQSDGGIVNDYDIFVMNADGSNPRLLTDNTSYDEEPAFAPDGKSIAYAGNRSGDWEVYVTNANGTQTRNVTNSPADEGTPAFSPDGRKIAFRSNRTGNWEIYIANADGSGTPTRLTDNPGGDGQIAFSPDGKRLAFGSHRDDNGEIYVANADGTNPVNATNSGVVHEFGPDWAPIYNDAFVDARPIDGSQAALSGSTLAATREPGEPDHFTNGGNFGWQGQRSVWYRWTAPASGTATIDTCETDFDTILSVYTGSFVGSLTRVAENSDACPSGWGSKVAFEARAGTAYKLAVSGPDIGFLQAGIFTLRLAHTRDDTPPETTIVSGPSGAMADNSAHLEFSSEGNARFECSLDGASLEACLSPKVYSGLQDGEHTFRVRAIDAAGNADPSPATRAWNVDQAKPAIGGLTPRNGAKIRDATPLVRALVRDSQANLLNGDIQLYVDGRQRVFSYNPSTDRLIHRAKPLKAGRHTVRVVAKDAAGNVATESSSFTVLRR